MMRLELELVLNVTKTPENIPLVFLAQCLMSITGAVFPRFCLFWTKIKWGNVKTAILGTNFLKSNKGSQQCKSLYEVTLFKDYDGSYLNFIYESKQPKTF